MYLSLPAAWVTSVGKLYWCNGAHVQVTKAQFVQGKGQLKRDVLVVFIAVIVLNLRMLSVTGKVNLT